jgi:hypothetical protein
MDKKEENIIRKLVEIEVKDSGKAEKAIWKDGKKIGSEEKIQVLYTGENKIKFLGETRITPMDKTCWSNFPIKKKGKQLFYARITIMDGNEYYFLEGNYEG